MRQQDLYRAESNKSVAEFIGELERVVTKSGFVVHNPETMAMANSFTRHGLQVPADFDLHMIQICKPEKALKSLTANPERAVLMPKFVMLFSADGKTQIRFLRFSAEDIAAVVDDRQFPVSLSETYERIVAMIEEAK